MARIFVCYSPSDRAVLKNLIPELRLIRTIEDVLYDEKIRDDMPWWNNILEMIAKSDIFIYLGSPESLSFPVCIDQRKEANRLGKLILYVKVHPKTPVENEIGSESWIDISKGVKQPDSIRKLYGEIYSLLLKLPYLPPHEILKDTLPTQKPEIPKTKLREADAIIRGARLAFLGTILTIVAIILAAVLPSLLNGNANNGVSQIASPTPTTLTPTSPANTATPTSTIDSAIATASVSVDYNDDWTPVERVFDGVTMVLVPVGCFNLGSIIMASDEESPTTRICFREPFWIDKYEVTNQQFAQFSGEAFTASAFSGDNRPRTNVTWFEARSFCRQRSVRLPTEVEWEYSARGPLNLIYPWSMVFYEDNVVYVVNSSSHTADVGSRSGGISWVGALNLSGNVAEWTSTLYQPYPYATDAGNFLIDDGREDANSSTQRVLRGGSWISDSLSVRASARSRATSSSQNFYIGFRCARDVVG